MGDPTDSPKEKSDSLSERRQKVALAALLLAACIAAFLFFEARDFRAQHRTALSRPPMPTAAKVEKLPVPPAAKQSLLPAAPFSPNSKPSRAVDVTKPAAGAPVAGIPVSTPAQRRVLQKRRASKRVGEKSCESYEEPLEGASGETPASGREKTGDLLETPLPQ